MKMNGYSILLKSTPDKPSLKYIGLALNWNSKYFDGCVNIYGKDSWVWFIYHVKTDTIVGFATMRYFECSDCGFLSRVAIVPSHRGKGLQRQAIQRRIAYARRLDWSGLLTYTVDDGYASINSLMHTGFSMYYPDYAWEGREMLYFRYLF